MIMRFLPLLLLIIWTGTSMAVFTNYVADTEKVVNGEFSKELKERFYNAAFEIAKKKMEEGQERLFILILKELLFQKNWPP